MAKAGPGQGPNAKGARKLHTQPFHDWPAPATGTYGVVLAQPIRGPGEPIHSQNPAGKGVRLGPELPGTLRHERVPWGLGKSPGGPDRRKLDACRDRRVAAPQFRPSNPGVACPPPGAVLRQASPPAPSRPAGPEPVGSLSAWREGAPGCRFRQ